MSRFPELFDEAIDSVVFEEALLVEVLAEHIASRIVERQDALRAEVTIHALWPIRRETPVTRLATQEMVTLIGIAAASPARTRRVVGVEATGINACPCAQGLVRGRRLRAAARGRLRRGRRRAHPRARPDRDAQPARPRNAARRHREPRGRSRSRRRSGTVDERARLRAAQAPRRALRSRARTPAAAVRRGLGSHRAAGDALRIPQPRRRRLRLLAPGQPRDDPRPWDVLAERAGTVGELRTELDTGAATGSQTELAEWPGPMHSSSTSRHWPRSWTGSAGNFTHCSATSAPSPASAAPTRTRSCCGPGCLRSRRQPT